MTFFLFNVTHKSKECTISRSFPIKLSENFVFSLQLRSSKLGISIAISRNHLHSFAILNKNIDGGVVSDCFKVYERPSPSVQSPLEVPISSGNSPCEFAIVWKAFYKSSFFGLVEIFLVSY